jgi:hypothetical protein
MPPMAESKSRTLFDLMHVLFFSIFILYESAVEKTQVDELHDAGYSIRPQQMSRE